MLIGFSLFIAVGFLVVFLWTVRSGQFDDDYTPSVRILFDDEVVKPQAGSEATQLTADGKSTEQIPKT